jgi:glycosyltransferase involved in cell wall biosynthesis
MGESQALINRMRIHLYANCWNELRILPYFMRHYGPFVDEFIILDDGSKDGSVEFLNAQTKVRLIKANRKQGSYVEQSTKFFNEAWKESRSKADWIITCNVDEHVYHKNIVAYLQFCLQNGVTVLSAQGYEMVSLEFPSSQGRLCDEVRLGAQTQRLSGPSSLLNKIMVFNPQAIQEVQFDMGRHTANPSGEVVYPYSVELKLLHYKFLGIDYAKQRYTELKSGLSSADQKQGVGIQYMWDTGKIKRNYESILIIADVVVPSGIISDASLNLSVLPQKMKLRLVELVTQHHRHPIIRLFLSLLNAVRRALSST